MIGKFSSRGRFADSSPNTSHNESYGPFGSELGDIKNTDYDYSSKSTRDTLQNL